MSMIKRLAAQLPKSWQVELKRIHYGNQIRRNNFVTDEPEYEILKDLINPGDWVVDIGANVGHYTKKFSELVGDSGRVIAIEPVPVTFSILAANTQKFKKLNVTLINAGISDTLSIAGISVPAFSTGLDNYYQAHISPSSDSELSVLTLPLDSLNLPSKVSLIKIDAEGHEEFVLKGMQELIKKSRPVLIIETGSEKIVNELAQFDYVQEKLKNSPNLLFRPNAVR
ncbi:hypothetical protein KEHDKFFH_08415 [Marinobacter maroccanus]|uniref:Methyltransferase FkbM domain-containing protein n=1 Tax=Marinobacter maroccanus TaxID=2055143 RepID=A0A2S5ZBE8_9GAMM|nr:FkbM family methyltransferase [Marinobacter maroccanus]PPI84716.1 hypothetical protein KEHDKFFH_08415 [Marinobacter maroccanus]